MERKLFGPEHKLFRESFRTFLEREVVPHHEQWEEDGIVPRSIWEQAGKEGFLCPWADEAYGGLGADFLYSAIIAEEIARAGTGGITFSLHSDIVAPYLAHYGTDEQKARYLTPAAKGESILAIAMTEPNTGSDLSAIQSTAILDGDHYLLNGQKTFISNGELADLVIVAAKTDPQADPPHAGVSLLLVEASTPGFQKGKRLKKIGLKAQDTLELYFEDCRVPKENILGGEGMGFYFLMQQLAQERLMVAIGAQAAAKRVLEMTIEYTKERKAFGRSVSRFQNTRFTLAEVATEIQLGQAFLDRVIEEHMAGSPLPTEASMAKWWITEMLKRNTDRCLQFFGGYGFMEEYPIAKAYIDARVQTIYAGTTEIMKEIISRNLNL
jgi:acyl-CoA dehydrogenase